MKASWAAESPLGTIDHLGFAIVMALIAFLGRENPAFVYPQILWSFLAFLIFNLMNFAFLSKHWGIHKRMTISIAANTLLISMIILYSGGTRSYFWVIYLLPIFSAVLSFERPGILTVLGSILLLTALSYSRSLQHWIWAEAIEMLIKMSTLCVSTRVLMTVSLNERKAVRLLAEEKQKTIHERMDMQDKLHHMDRLATMGTLSASITHELKNPLASILASCEFALAEGCKGEDLHKTLLLIQNSATRCGQTIKNMLDFSRQQAQERRPEDVNALVRKCVELKRHDWVDSERRLTVEELYDPALPPVPLSGAQLQQVVFNLLTNAEQSIRSNPATQGLIRVRTQASPDRIRILVEDNGPGIPPDKVREIWKPFFTTKPQGQGTGLGLSISRKITEEHGGTLTVESDPGILTTFILEFPNPKKPDAPALA